MSSVASALAVAAALRGGLEVSDQSELRIRNGYGLSSAVVDLETTPTIKLDLSARWLEIATGYGPHFSILQVGAGAQPQILHRAWATAKLHERRGSIAVYAEGSYGDQLFATLAPEPTVAPGMPSLQAIPQASLIHYASSTIGFTAELRASRRFVLGAFFEYDIGGGVDIASRAALPFQSGPHGGISAQLALSRHDWLGPVVSASRTVFSSGEDDTLVQTTASWRHAFGRQTESTLAGGLAWSWTVSGASASAESATYPVIEATLAHRSPPARVDTRLSLRFAPVADWLTGLVSERLEEIGAVAWRPLRKLTIEGQLGGAQTVPSTQAGAMALVIDGVAVSCRVSKFLELRGGARNAWTTTRGAPGTPPLWVAFLGATFTAPRIRF
jgi:hypothetical protein